LNCDASRERVIDDNRLYRALDRLLPRKTALERRLTARYGELFSPVSPFP
jgi:hypothetical protein